MKTIAVKLSAVKSAAAATGWESNDLRALIHGCGGSPKRAIRLLKHSPGVARMLAEAYAAALAEGMHHVHAVKACNEMFLSIVPKTATTPEAPEGGEGEAEAEPVELIAEQAELPLAPAKPAKGKAKGKSLADLAALIATA